MGRGVYGVGGTDIGDPPSEWTQVGAPMRSSKYLERGSWMTAAPDKGMVGPSGAAVDRRDGLSGARRCGGSHGARSGGRGDGAAALSVVIGNV